MLDRALAAPLSLSRPLPLPSREDAQRERQRGGPADYQPLQGTVAMIRVDVEDELQPVAPYQCHHGEQAARARQHDLPIEERRQSPHAFTSQTPRFRVATRSSRS